MPSNIDQVADAKRGSVELVRLSKIYDFPAFVGSRPMEDTLNPQRLSKSAYADPRFDQFPCHTAASTWISALFYHEKKAEFHPKDQKQIENRLNARVEYFNIKTAVDAIMKRWAELHKSADEQLPDSMFAYVWAQEDGTKKRTLRLKTAAEVKAAAEYLEQYRDCFPFAARHIMAKKILEKAASYGAAIKPQMEFLEKQAGRGVCDPVAVVRMIEKRASFVKDPALKAHFGAMAKTISERPKHALQPDMLVKLADTVDQLDRNLNLTSNYAQGLERPEDVLFSATFAKAAEESVNLVATTSGACYEKSAFRKLSAEDISGLFGPGFAERVITPLGEVDIDKMAEEVATLPRPDAEMLDGLLSDNGIAPMMRKAASTKQGFSDAQMAAIAESYLA